MGKNLEYSLKQAAEVFSGDVDIANSLVADHPGHTVDAGNMFDEVSRVGVYQPRIPAGTPDELRRVEESPDITIFCFDRRQGKQVADKLMVNSQLSAKLSIAGGAAQTEKERVKAVVDLVVGFNEVNPDGLINLVAHTGRCGGVVKYMGVSFYDMITKKSSGGWDGPSERDMMANLVNGIAYELRKAGVSSNVIFKYLSHLNGEEFKGITEFR